MNSSLLSKALLCLMFVAVVFTGCKKDEADADDCTTSGTFTCKINGQTFTATSFQNTLFKGTDSNVEGKRLDIRAKAANGTQLILTLSDFRDGKDGNNFRLDSYYYPANQQEYGYCGTQNGNTACVAALATYYRSSGATDYVITYPGGDDLDSTHNVTITANNAGDLTISGTFKVTIEDVFGGGNDVVITDGVFTNVCYTVIEQ